MSYKHFPEFENTNENGTEIIDLTKQLLYARCCMKHFTSNADATKNNGCLDSDPVTW